MPVPEMTRWVGLLANTVAKKTLRREGEETFSMMLAKAVIKSLIAVKKATLPACDNPRLTLCHESQVAKMKKKNDK